MIDKIMDMGGMLSCIESGWVKRQISDASYRYQRMVENKEQIIVGVNRFQMEETAPENLLRVNPAIAEARAGELRTWRAQRPADRSTKLLEGLTRASAGTENLVPLIIEAVKAGATLGEVSAALEDTFGRYQERPEV